MYILTILYDTAADKGKILAYGNSPKREKCAPNSNLGGMEEPQALHLHSAVPALPARGRDFFAGKPADPEKRIAPLRALRPKNVRRHF